MCIQNVENPNEAFKSYMLEAVICRKLRQKEFLISVLEKFNIPYSITNTVYCGQIILHVREKNININNGYVRSLQLDPAMVHPTNVAYNPEDLLCQELGMDKLRLYKEIERRIEVDCSYEAFYISQYTNEDEAVEIVLPKFEDIESYTHQPFPLTIPEELHQEWYYYRSHDSAKVIFGVAYTHFKNYTISLPVVFCRGLLSYRKQAIWRHPAPLYPLYNLHELEARHDDPVLVTTSEPLCEGIIRQYPDIAAQYVMTTWSSGEMVTIADTDWGYLRDRSITVLVSLNREGFLIAANLYRAMKGTGSRGVRFLLRYHGIKAASEDFIYLDHDITALRTGCQATLGYSDFVANARSLFGLDLEPGQYEAGTGFDLLELANQAIEYVIEPVLRKGDKILICGFRGHGKTYLVIQLLAALIGGKALFSGKWRTPKPFRVLAFFGEMPGRDLGIRYKQYIDKLLVEDESHSNCRFFSSAQIEGGVRLDIDDEWKKYKDSIAWSEIIIIDSVCTCFVDAMGNDFSSATVFNQRLEELTKMGKTVIVLDHLGKNGNSAFGTIAKEVKLDMTWKLKKEKQKDTFTLTVGKNRNQSDEGIDKITYSIDFTSTENKELLASQDKNTQLLDEAAAMSEVMTDTSETMHPVVSVPPEPTSRSLVLAYYQENPDASLREAVKHLVGRLKKSQIGKLVKGLREDGLLPLKACKKKA